MGEHAVKSRRKVGSSSLHPAGNTLVVPFLFSSIADGSDGCWNLRYGVTPVFVVEAF